MKIYFSSNLRFLRDSKGWSQEELGEKLEKDYTTIGKWENGTRNPIMEDVIKLSLLFNINLDQLMLSDLRVKKNDENKKIEKFAMDKGIGIEIGQNAELTPKDTTEALKFITEETNKKD